MNYVKFLDNTLNQGSSHLYLFGKHMKLLMKSIVQFTVSRKAEVNSAKGNASHSYLKYFTIRVEA